MTTLSDAMKTANRLVDAEDYSGAEVALKVEPSLLEFEQDVQVVLEYAQLCHYWGTPDCEEAALRVVLRKHESVEVFERILDVLQERMNYVEGQARLLLAAECETFGTRALGIWEGPRDDAWANLVCCRGIRRLELARSGRSDLIEPARGDLESYRHWLVNSDLVPVHQNRESMIAFVGIDLSELLLLESRWCEASELLENAIKVLESLSTPSWMVNPAYLLLERAYAGS